MHSGVALRSQPSYCRENPDYELCQKNILWHANAYTPVPVKTIFPIGLARDGKVIYGPYNSNGELWNPCDVDMCNGRNMDSTHYGYVATMFFPYTVGCWGPGNRGANVQPSCSANARFCDNAVMMMGSIYLALATVIVSFIFA
jgi:hypothetical protein